MNNRTCSVEGCTKPHRAKGLCNTHYGQQRQPNRHRKVAMVCDGCGKLCMKGIANTRATRFCTLACREMYVHTRPTGSWSVELPARHPARGYAAKAKADLSPIAERECAWCGLRFHPKRRVNQNYCSKACGIRSRKASRRALEFNSVGVYTWTDVMKLWVSFNKQCAYCATPTPLTNIQAEHVIALHCGGANNLSNLLPSCGACNSDKRDLTLDAWTNDRARRKLPQVTTTWSDSNPRYKHLTSVRGHS